MTEVNTTEPLPPGPIIPTLGIRLFGSISYSVLSIFGLALNILLIIIFIKNRSSLKNNAFYTIAWQLIICDVFTHLMEFIVPIPITAAAEQIYGDSLLLYIPCFIDTIVYNGTLFFSFLMTINRFTVFILPRVNQIIFQRQGIYYTIAFMWIFVIVFIVAINIFACNKKFDENGFYYYHDCPPLEELNPIGRGLKVFSAAASTYLPVAMFVAYVFMIIYIKTKLTFEWKGGKLVRRRAALMGNSSGMNWKTEFSLLAQSFLICAFIEVQNLAFEFFPRIQAEGQWTIVLNIVGNWVSLLLCSIHPIVLFIFNRDIRQRLLNLFRNLCCPTKVQPLITTSAIVSTVSRLSK